MFKVIWLHTVRAYIRLGLFFYFKKIDVHNINRISINKPVLLLSNHQNALLDALIIAAKLNRFAYFLTRAGVFKKVFVSRLLNSLNMLPVYRIRDGFSNLTNNNMVFDKCSDILMNNGIVAIFPEGSHNLARRVRPLSKGFTRIVFDTIEKHPDIELQLIPLGLNFVNAIEFVDSAAIYVGKPIEAKDYLSETRNENVLQLKKRIQVEISKLTSHIPIENYNETLDKLNGLNIDYLDPESVNSCIDSNFENCNPKSKSSFLWIRKGLKCLMLINIFLPYIIWKLVLQPKIKELEFTSTFRFAVAITLVPFYLLLISIVLVVVFNIKLAIIYIIASLILALLAVKL